MNKKPYFTVLVLLSLIVRINIAAAMENCYLGVSTTARSFMPKNFQLIMTKYENDLFKGTLLKNPRGIVWEKTFASDKKKAAEMVEIEAVYIIKAIRTQKHFSEITYHFGVMSHYLTDMGMPLRLPGEDNYANIGVEFEKLMDSNISKFRVLFNGYNNIAPQKDSFSEIALSMLDGKIGFEKKLVQVFEKNGQILSYKKFDERSVPF